MTVLSIVISSAIAIAVVILFRHMDRDNNSMDKVKKYTDNRIAGLDSYFKEQSEKLNGLSAELDTRQTKAFATIKNLERQIEEFRNISVGFEKC